MTYNPHSLKRTVLALAVAAVAPVLSHADAATDARIQALENHINELERKLDRQSGKLEVQAVEVQNLAYPPADKVLVKGDGKSVKFETDDKAFSYQVGGRLQADAAFYDADNSPGTSGAFGDGTKFRRIFLDVRGIIASDWNYRLQYDFARPGAGDSSARGIRDAYIQYTGLGPYPITIGSHKEYLGLEHLTSGLYSTFIERSVADLFSADRHIGIGIGTYRPNWTANIGLFGERPEGDAANEGDEGQDVAARVTWAPIAESGNVVHLGIAGRHHSPKDSTTELRLRERPESNITDVRLIDTGNLASVDNTRTLGLEAAVVQGPFSVQGEYLTTTVARDNNLSDLDFNGWYLYGSWFLTGESRVYKTKDGLFDRVSPLDKTLGAWEVALRYSSADLTDGTVIGGEQDNLTLGVNWYATSNIRLSANYLHLLDVDRPGSVYDGQELDTLLFRAQYDF